MREFCIWRAEQKSSARKVDQDIGIFLSPLYTPFFLSSVVPS